MTTDEIRERIVLNLKYLCAAADQHFLQTKTTEVPAATLIPRYSLTMVKSIDGEDYGALVLKQGVPTRIATARGMEISYGWCAREGRVQSTLAGDPTGTQTAQQGARANDHVRHASC